MGLGGVRWRHARGGFAVTVEERLAEASSTPAGPGTPTVVLIDDAQVMRHAVRRALSKAGMLVVGEADCAEAGLRAVLDLRPDVVLTDLFFQGSRSIEAIERIAELAPASRILVLTKARDCLLEAITAGAWGYILKDAGSAEIVKAVRASAAGECVLSSEVAGALIERIRERDIRPMPGGERTAESIRSALTERELQVFTRLPSGDSNHEIACALSLSENTVKNHVASILAKLRLNNRIQAAVLAARNGYSAVTGLFLLEVLSNEADVPGVVVSFLLGG
jgi:DNA-binding NarL/FixJ family response regulator